MTSRPKLPAPLGTLWSKHHSLQEAYETLAGMTLEEALKAIQATRHTVSGMVCYELTPHRVHPPEEAIVLTLPFANTFRPDLMLRGWLLQQSLPTSQRLIVFPQNTLGKPAYALPAAERKLVRKGNFGPIAAQQALTLRHLGVRRCSIVGYSLGAATGARLFRELASSDIAVQRAGFFEAPNILPRNRLHMVRAFSKGGRTALNQAIKDANIPALNALRSTDSTHAKVKDFFHFFLFILSSLLPANRAIMAGTTHPTFLDDLMAAYATLAEQGKHPTKMIIGAAEKSDITPPAILNTHAQALEKANLPVRTVLVKNYGHELGDNIAAHAVLAHMALT